MVEYGGIDEMVKVTALSRQNLRVQAPLPLPTTILMFDVMRLLSNVRVYFVILYTRPMST